MDHKPSAIGCLSLTLTVADAPKLQITLTSTVAPDAGLQRKPKLQHKPNLSLSLSIDRGGDQGLGVYSRLSPRLGWGLGSGLHLRLSRSLGLSFNLQRRLWLGLKHVFKFTFDFHLQLRLPRLSDA